MKKKLNILIFAAMALTGITFLTACSSTQPPAPSTGKIESAVSFPDTMVPFSAPSAGGITVNSSEKVSVTPDIAQVIYSVRTQNKDAAACQKQNTENVNQVIELLKSLGIKAESMQTSDYYMNPIYDYSSNTQNITGYEAVTSLTVSDLPIEGLGDLLAKSVSSGVNSIQSVTYESSGYDAAYQEALKLAMNSALQKAQALAEAGGCTLGGVINVQENSNYSSARYTDNVVSAKSAAGMSLEESASDMNIMPGKIEVEVNITVQYAL